MYQMTSIFLFGREFEAEELPGQPSWDISRCKGWLDKDFGLFNDTKIRFIIERKQKDLCLAFFGKKSFFMAKPFFSLDNRNDDPVSKYKFSIIDTFGRPRKPGSINDSLEDWPANLASKFLITAIETLSNIEEQVLYGHLEQSIYDKMSSFAYRICRNLDWSNPKAQGPCSEQILELIVKTAIEESARTFSITGDFDFTSDFKNMKFDAVQLGAHILATGKLPETSLRHFKKDSGRDLCLEDRS